MMNRRSVFLGLLIVALVAIGFVGVRTFMGVSAEELRQAESSCVRWFKEDIDLGGSDSFSSDVWEKDGFVVVEVGFDRRGASYSTRLCVYDPSTNGRSSPGAFDRSRWER